MTEQLQRLVEPDAVEITGDATLTPPAVATPVLITEAEVAFGTAAAAPLRPTTGWRVRANHFAAAVREMFASSTTDDGPRYNHHPKRMGYLEDSRMAREMDRL